MPPKTMRRLRKIHTYLGVFFAPAIIFFAFTGALQTFSLHENKSEGPYQPPAWIVTLASVHKDQQLPRPKHRPAPPAPALKSDGRPGQAGKAVSRPQGPSSNPRPSPLPLKVFTLLLSIGLISTALVGLYIALTNRALQKTAAIVLAAGILAPLVLLFV